MKVTHLQSSTQIIQVGNTRVLTDPWLTEGEYYGSWFHYPPFGDENILLLEYDYIYVSHIHPDHLSEATFKKLPRKKPVLIHKYESRFVKNKLEMLGFEVIECEHATSYHFGENSSLTIYAADNCDPSLCSKFLGCGAVETKFASTQIDTLAVFSDGDEVLINTNDCPYELAAATILANGINKLDVSLLLVGYGGAGPYPQCFEFETISKKTDAAAEKEKYFLDQAVKFIELLEPKRYAPFAGTYVLGSRLSHLTRYRGVPTIASALDYISKNLKEPTIGLHLEKFDEFNLSTNNHVKANAIPVKSYDEYMKEISIAKLAYDDDQWDDVRLPDLLESAYERFSTKAKEIGFSSKTSIIIQSSAVRYIFGTDVRPRKISNEEVITAPFVRITVDHNLLHRLLMGPRFAHWNNAEIGSHLRYQRNPDTFERGLYHCLCFLHQ